MSGEGNTNGGSALTIEPVESSTQDGATAHSIVARLGRLIEEDVVLDVPRAVVVRRDIYEHGDLIWLSIGDEPERDDVAAAMSYVPPGSLLVGWGWSQFTGKSQREYTWRYAAFN